jgi:Ni/Co efflux regulator RcnB
MNHRLIQAALLAATLAGGTAVHAQDRHDRNERNERYEQRNDDHRGDRRDHDRRDFNDGRRNDRVDYHHDGRDDRNRGAGPRHDLRKGGRLPADYRSRQYVVDDWRGHRLSAPPRGYHWVQTGNDYVLAAVATGVIASILLGQ